MKSYSRLFILSVSTLVFVSCQKESNQQPTLAYGLAPSQDVYEFRAENLPSVASECFQKLDYAVAESMSIDVDESFGKIKHQLLENVILGRMTSIEAAKDLVLIDSKRTEFFDKLSYFRTTHDSQRFDAFKNYCRTADSLGLKLSHWTDSEKSQSLCECVSDEGSSHESDNVRCMTRQVQVEFCDSLQLRFKPHEHAHSDDAEKGEERSTILQSNMKSHKAVGPTCEDLFK